MQEPVVTGIFEVQPDGNTSTSLASQLLGGVGGAPSSNDHTCLLKILIVLHAETFGEMFPTLSYKARGSVHTISFTFANFGQVKIIAYSVPVLIEIR